MVHIKSLKSSAQVYLFFFLSGFIHAKKLTTNEDMVVNTETIPAHQKSILPSIPKLKEVFDFIEANYHQPITLSEVANLVGYSPNYLTSLVRCQTGKTLYRWIMERRMAQACSLLLNTEQPVHLIAQAVGYSDAGHFTRQFRQLYNTTPKMWRTKYRIARIKQ